MPFDRFTVKQLAGDAVSGGMQIRGGGGEAGPAGKPLRGTGGAGPPCGRRSRAIGVDGVHAYGEGRTQDFIVGLYEASFQNAGRSRSRDIGWR